MVLFTLLKKAPIRGAFFVFVLLLSACAQGGEPTSLYQVKTVIDGDTLRLKNGEKVRFVGINTPELGHGRFKDEPFAEKAKQFLTDKINGKAVRLEFTAEKKDRHGRLLAHVFNQQGQNLQSLILKAGLGYAVAVGHNFNHLEAYLKAEKKAKTAKKGIWGDPFFAPVSAAAISQKKSRGYKRIIGKVLRVSRSKKNRTLHLENDFRILIRRDNWKQYFKIKPRDLKNKQIEARGWLFKAGKIKGLKIYHPSMLEILN